MAKLHKTPYTIPVYDLMHRPGEMRHRALNFSVPEKLGEGLMGVEPGACLEGEVKFESTSEGILVTVEAHTVARGVCSRCLRDIEQPVQVEFCELFAYSSDEAYDYAVHEDHVDLESVIRDAVVLSLPFQPVCQAECLGLDPQTGERITDPSFTFGDEYDPRWSALQQVKVFE